MENTIKADMNSLSRSIATVHKTLLHFQKDLYEKSKGKALSVHEFLHLTINDSDFEWLRKLSTLIVQIDEAVDGGEVDLGELQKEVIAELRGLFIDPQQNVDFKARIMQALGNDSSLWLDISDLRKRL